MRIQYYIRPRNTTEESALVEEDIQAIAERQWHGRRGCVVGRLAAAPGAGPGGPGAVQEGGAQVLALRTQGARVRQRRGRAALAPPGLRLLPRRTGRTGSTRGVRGARGGGVARAVGGAGQPVHA